MCIFACDWGIQLQQSNNIISAYINISAYIIEDNKKIAENFNFYFSQIGSNLAKTITQGGKTFHDFLTAPNDQFNISCSNK